MELWRLIPEIEYSNPVVLGEQYPPASRKAEFFTVDRCPNPNQKEDLFEVVKNIEPPLR